MIRAASETGYMSGQEFVGSAIFFYVLLPSLIIMGIWFIVRDLSRDEDYNHGCESFADDFIGPVSDTSDMRASLLEQRKNR